MGTLLQLGFCCDGGAGGGLIPHDTFVDNVTIAEGESGTITTLDPVPYDAESVTLQLNGVGQPRGIAWQLDPDGVVTWLATAPTGIDPDDGIIITWQSSS